MQRGRWRNLSRHRKNCGWVLGIKLTFPKASITRLSKHSGFFSTGLRIEHSAPRAPQFIVFWTFDFPTLAKELALLGSGNLRSPRNSPTTCNHLPKTERARAPN